MPDSRSSLAVRIVPHEPLLLGDESGTSNFVQSTDHIPGSVIRGALAARLLQEVGLAHDRADCANPDCAFCALFQPDDIHFGFAYYGATRPVWPNPLTARSCKTYSGFRSGRPEADAPKHHGVVDVLLADLAYEMVSDPHFPLRDLLQPHLDAQWHPAADPLYRAKLDICGFRYGDGRTCAEEIGPITGEYRWFNRPEGADSPPIERRTHVGINRARGVAEDGLLFTQEALAPGRAQFYGTITTPANKLERLKALLQGDYYLGGDRSRGFGRVTFSTDSPGAYPDLETRLQTFNADLAQALAPYEELDSRVTTALSGRLFSLTLRAPTLLMDPGGSPVRFPLPTQIGLPAAVQRVQAWARMSHVGGWDSASGRPRRTRLAVRAGSVFVYHAPESLFPPLVEQLKQLELYGIGEERQRGYGEVTVCAGFHTAMARK